MTSVSYSSVGGVLAQVLLRRSCYVSLNGSTSLAGPSIIPLTTSSGVATGWTGVDMSTPLLPEVIPEIDANPMTFLGSSGGGVVVSVSESVR